MELTLEERLEALEKKAESANFVEIRNLIDKIATRFEVGKYRIERFELLTLSNVIHHVVSDRDTTAKVLNDLQAQLGISLEFFKQLRLAYGWAGFISPTTGVEIPERPGNAQLVQDYLLLIEKKLGYELIPDKYAEITQEFLDNRNNKARENLAQTVIQDDEYKALLAQLAV